MPRVGCGSRFWISGAGHSRKQASTATLWLIGCGLPGGRSGRSPVRTRSVCGSRSCPGHGCSRSRSDEGREAVHTVLEARPRPAICVYVRGLLSKSPISAGANNIILMSDGFSTAGPPKMRRGFVTAPGRACGFDAGIRSCGSGYRDLTTQLFVLKGDGFYDPAATASGGAVFPLGRIILIITGPTVCFPW